MVTNEERAQRYAEAVRREYAMHRDSRAKIARAVMAVADAEQAELRAWLTDARAALRNMDRLLTEVNADADHMEAAEAKVARVEALLDQWDGEVGAVEDYQHSSAVRAVEACIRDLGAALRACACPPCPGRGHDGHGLSHCAECCFGSGVIADEDCPMHGRAALDGGA